jgi:hypothetical protein
MHGGSSGDAPTADRHEGPEALTLSVAYDAGTVAIDPIESRFRVVP